MSRIAAIKTVLVTGGAGFIGSNFVIRFLKNHPGIKVVNLDKLTYAGTLENLRPVMDHPNHIFIEGDICDFKLLTGIFEDHQVDAVVHFAAESHVDRSIERPSDFVTTNVIGTYVLLESARHFWQDPANRLFQHVSTDEVYGSLGESGYFKETTAYAPNSPYSATKASSDFLVRSYHHTYGLPVATSQCTNNFGPHQHEEKLIPTIIRNAVKGNPIPIYGKGENVRDWLFVGDHCDALELILDKGIPGATYVIGGDNEHDNLYIARTVCELLDELRPKEKGSYKEQIALVEDRPGHDFRYAVDHTKITSELGWEPETEFKSALEKTVRWYLNNKYKQ